MNELSKQDVLGVTPIERPAPRRPHDVHKLGRAIISIETIDESTVARFDGSHARYVLRSPVKINEIVRASYQGAAA